MDDLFNAGNEQLAILSRAARHSSGANSTPVTFWNPYSAARIQARPRPHPKSANRRVLDKRSRLRRPRNAQAFTGPYEVACLSLEGSKDVFDSSIWPLVRTPYRRSKTLRCWSSIMAPQVDRVFTKPCPWRRFRNRVSADEAVRFPNRGAIRSQSVGS
jgi:hypothetical protein